MSNDIYKILEGIDKISPVAKPPEIIKKSKLEQVMNEIEGADDDFVSDDLYMQIADMIPPGTSMSGLGPNDDGTINVQVMDGEGRTQSLVYDPETNVLDKDEALVPPGHPDLQLGEYDDDDDDDHDYGDALDREQYADEPDELEEYWNAEEAEKGGEQYARDHNPEPVEFGEPEEEVDEARGDSWERKFNKIMSWDNISSPGGPKGMMARIRDYSDEELIKLVDQGGGDGSARGAFNKLAARELKRRFGVSPGGDMQESMDDKDINTMPNGEIEVKHRDGSVDTFDDEETAAAMLNIEKDMNESAQSAAVYKPGDTVSISDNLADRVGKKYVGKRGKVAFTQGDAVFVKIDRGPEVEFRANELIKEGFGDYDDFEIELDGPVDEGALCDDVNPDMVPFDADNIEHRERLQRGTRVILVPVLFSEPGTDRGGVLSDIGKTGFFCKVIRNADGKTINVHMSDIESADLYNNTVYEGLDMDYQKEFDKVMEDITVTRTENPENPELDTITITGTDNSVDELESIIQSAGIDRQAEPEVEPMPADAFDGGDTEIVTDGEEELLTQMRREIHGEEEGIDEELANAPDERVAPVGAALAGGGLNKRKRQFNKWHAADNAMAIDEAVGSLEQALHNFDSEELLSWVYGTESAGGAVDDAVNAYAVRNFPGDGYEEDGSGRGYEKTWYDFKDEVEGYAREMEQYHESADEEEWNIDDQAAADADIFGIDDDDFDDPDSPDKEYDHIMRMRRSAGLSEINYPDDAEWEDDENADIGWSSNPKPQPKADGGEMGRIDKTLDQWEKDDRNEKFESKKPGAPLDEVESFLNLYKAFGERGEKKTQ